MMPYRFRQAIQYLLADRQAPPDIPEDALALLTEPMLHQFRILSPGDQQHLIEVFHQLQRRGAERETVTAGLIHDVGKGCMKCRITVVHRAVHILLSRVLPQPYRWFAGVQTVPDRLMGLHRLANHPERGALAAEQAGYSRRVCWLVQHHESGGDPNDCQLRMLRDADAATGSVPAGIKR